VTSPLKSLANCRLIVRPNPVPLNLRVIDASAWANGRNSRSNCSGVIPIPVSITSTRSMIFGPPAPSSVIRISILPDSVNFTALPSRLTRICLSRNGSLLISCGIGPSNVTPNPSPFSAARGRMREMISDSSAGRSQEIRSTFICPASTFERSRISLMSSSRCKAFR
jgi:hypothetical protein